MAKRSKKAQEAFEIAEPIAKEMGFDLVDAEYKKEGKDLYLRLFIDKKGGISIDECEAFNRVIDPILDEKMDSDADYFEVSSPGLLRPLDSADDFRRYDSEIIEVSLFAEKDGLKQFQGSIKEVTDKDVTFVTEDGQEICLEYKEISKAVRHIEF